ncbi:MAG: hypothetical protein R6U70_10930 [Bacillota bacterium]
MSIVVRFDPETDLVLFLETMRYRDATDEARTLWIAEARWGDIGGADALKTGAVTWFDQGDPWAVFRVEDIRFNADVAEYIRARGP